MTVINRRVSAAVTIKPYSFLQEEKWELKSPMGTKRSALSTAVLGEDIYVIGGYDGNSGLCTVEVYVSREDGEQLK